jgi:hypothetical protein
LATAALKRPRPAAPACGPGLRPRPAAPAPRSRGRDQPRRGSPGLGGRLVSNARTTYRGCLMSRRIFGKEFRSRSFYHAGVGKSLRDSWETPGTSRCCDGARSQWRRPGRGSRSWRRSG